jgi:hypothetical protein
VPFVSAHGSTNFAVIDGIRYNAPNPNGDSGQYAIRAINDINPVKGTGNPDMNCGHNAKIAALVADASPGSTVEFSWRNGEGGTWVHNTGPIMTYMASCGDGGCATFDSANAQFFKIAEQGRKEDGQWTMADLTTGPEATTKVTLPSTLPAGEYLIRHELIAMQLGMTEGGAEFYPACLQIRLAAPARTAASLPSGDQVVTFPGGYSDSDPGIHDTNIYNPGNDYVFPGPALITDAVIANPDTPVNVPAPTSTTPIPGSISATPEPTPTTGSGCGNPNKKKRTIVKRIVRQGPLIKRTSKASAPNKRQIVDTNPWKRTDHSKPAVRSRVMRGVF